MGQYRDRKIRQIDPETGRVIRTSETDRFVTGVTWLALAGSLSRAPQAIRVQSVDQGAPRDAEQLRGFGLVAGASGQRFQDPTPFLQLAGAQLEERRGAGTGRLGDWRDSPGFFEREVLGSNRAPTTQHDRTIDHVAELANVSRPRVRE